MTHESVPAVDLAISSAERDERAADRDAQARDRDGYAAERDVKALGRDRRQRALTDDVDTGFADRFQSAGDRDDAAGDRADALSDRRDAKLDRAHAAADREQQVDVRSHDADEAFQRALEDRTTIGQAQGLLMGDMGLTPDEAFDVLRVEAQGRGVRVLAVAVELVDGHRAAKTRRRSASRDR